MRKIVKDEWQNWAKVPRLNFVNSLTGYKSANLIATKSKNGIENAAVFSSITHLGSDPALLGFILRPTTVPRHTYQNIKDSRYFSVNHITEHMISDAHHTSASYDEGTSEFEKTQLETDYKEGIEVPFVKNSPVQLLCKYVNEYEIVENGCIHLIASIEAVFVEEELLHNDKWVQLDKGNIVSINGLDGYAQTQLIDRFAYARPNIPTQSLLKNGT